MHPYLGALAQGSYNRVMRSNTGVSATTVTSSATAYNNITPVQIVASTAFDVSHIWVRLSATYANTATRSDTVFEVMAGAASSEYTIIGPVLIGGRGTGAVLSLPIFIPAGTRLSVRVRSARTSLGVGFLIDYAGMPNADSVGLPSEWIAYGVVDDASANARGTIVVPGATNTWGSWTALTTSTTYAHDLWMPMMDGGTFNAGSTTAKNYRSQFAVATTTNAATQVTNSTQWEGPMIALSTAEAVTDTYFNAGTSFQMGLGSPSYPLIYAPAPAGSAVSARVMCSGTIDTNVPGCAVLAAH